MEHLNIRSVLIFSSGQRYFDQLVENVNCTLASDALDCLRSVPIDVMRSAVNASPSVFGYEVCILRMLVFGDFDTR